jgi:hypothetical protein
MRHQQTIHEYVPDERTAISLLQLRAAGPGSCVVVVRIDSVLCVCRVDVRWSLDGTHAATVIEPDHGLLAELANRPFAMARLASLVNGFMRGDPPRLPVRLDDPRDHHRATIDRDDVVGEREDSGWTPRLPALIVLPSFDDLETQRFEIDARFDDGGVW